MELLAPAGNYQSALSAINAGADAIYIGGKSFSARSYSSNFTNDEIKELIKYAHIRDVKVYVTLNTLIFEDEFFDAVEFAKFLYFNDVDGILLQDLGLASYLHKVFPSLVLHASTQLNCHNLIQAKSLIDLGFKRIVLAREASLSLAKEIKKLGVEVEVFVQGALCVCYSGNCLMSSFIGGRSGNRGKCAQPCRHHNKVGYEGNYLKEYAISTKDLMTLDYIQDLIESGVDSLKIEGRMKKEEYVYQVVSSYRKALDIVNYNYLDDLDKIQRLFSRKFTSGYIFSTSRLEILNQDTPSNIGIEIGEVIASKENQVIIKLSKPLHLHDGIKFINEELNGMLVTSIKKNNVNVEEAYPFDIVSLRTNLKIKKNTKVNKTSDYLLDNEIDEKIKINKLIPLELTISGEENNCLNLILKDNHQHIIEYKSDFILQKAISKPTSQERIIEQIKKVDDFPYYFEKINYQITSDIFIPISLINKARREILEMMNKKRENFNHYDLKEFPYKNDFILEKTNKVLVKCENNQDISFLGKEFTKGKLNSDEYDFNFKERIDDLDDAILEENQMTSYYKIAYKNAMMSYYGSVTNSYTLDLLFSKGYSLVFASLECSKRQILLMNKCFYLRHGFYPNLGVLIYGKIDYMIMKSCPIATSLGMKKDHCQLCKKNQYYLKDHLNVCFPLITSSSCITRVLSDKVICLFSKLKELKENNINNFMIDFTIEDNDQIKKVISLYKEEKSLLNKDFFGHYLNEIE